MSALSVAPGRLLVLAPNWLGDAVMALPLVADLRRAWPETEIAIAARRSVVPLFEMVPGVTHTLTLDSGGGLRGMSSWRRDATLLAAGGFDAALLLPNSFHAAWLASRAGIPERWGVSRDLRGRLLTRVLPRPERQVHQAAYYQALGSGLGVTVGERFARIEVADDDRARARMLLREAGVADDQRFVVFAPGAAYGRAKQWLPERFAELAILLAEQDIATVLVGTRADERACREVAGRTRHLIGAQGTGTGHVGALGTRHSALGTSGIPNPANLSGRTDLTTLAGVLSLSDAVVSNDSGAMHLAAATGARVIAVFGSTDHRKTSPLRASADAPAPMVLAASVWCRPCMLRECPIDHRCMTRVSARAVFAALGLDPRRS